MHTRASLLLCCLLLALAEARGQLIALPEPPPLTQAGHSLIVEFETGGKADYDRWPRPEWPQGASGVTVGIGYDCGYNSKEVIWNDWSDLEHPNAARLAATSGIRGAQAKPLAKDLADILIQWSLAMGVFDRVTVTRFWRLARQTYPGFDDLRPNAQAALVSLTFNRGSDMVGDRRYEMRQIRSCAARRDYEGMASWNRRSIRVWKGTSIYEGMVRRREAESALILTP